jgi:hypothetical protein
MAGELVQLLCFGAHYLAPCGAAVNIRAILRILLAVMVSLKC